MSDLVVLDASALLCLLYGEVGGDRVERVVPGAPMSKVNYAEVVSKLVERGRYDSETKADLERLRLNIVALDVETSELAGLLRAETRQAGLSLGDRCCLALAKKVDARVVTTDRAWVSIDVGVPVELVR